MSYNHNTYEDYLEKHDLLSSHLQRLLTVIEVLEKHDRQYKAKKDNPRRQYSVEYTKQRQILPHMTDNTRQRRYLSHMTENTGQWRYLPDMTDTLGKYDIYQMW